MDFIIVLTMTIRLYDHLSKHTWNVSVPFMSQYHITTKYP